MKLRFFACVALALVVAGASALSSRMARAQAGRSGQGQSSELDRGRSAAHSADVDKALQAYDQRMDRNLDRCRHELDEMKKELHDLVDLRLSMAISLAELRARHATPGMGFSGTGAPDSSYRKAQEGGGQASQGRGETGEDTAALMREIQQIHNQLRSEIDQQQNQVTQLAAQLRELKGQGHQGQQPGQGRQAQQGQQPGQGQPSRSEGQGHQRR